MRHISLINAVVGGLIMWWWSSASAEPKLPMLTVHVDQNGNAELQGWWPTDTGVLHEEWERVQPETDVVLHHFNESGNTVIYGRFKDHVEFNFTFHRLVLLHPVLPGIYRQTTDLDLKSARYYNVSIIKSMYLSPTMTVAICENYDGLYAAIAFLVLMCFGISAVFSVLFIRYRRLQLLNRGRQEPGHTSGVLPLFGRLRK